MDLAAVVAEAQRRGFVGPTPVGEAIEHARGFAQGAARPPGRLLDLGSGGGLPGLVLAGEWPTAWVTLLEANGRRCAFLRDAVAGLGWSARVEVLEARAEEAARDADHRGSYDAVTARGFGRPAVTAECGSPFLRVGGRLLVSEPPRDDSPTGVDRWPEKGLALLGLTPAETWVASFSYRALVQAEACPRRYPRRVGVPSKRPLF